MYQPKLSGAIDNVFCLAKKEEKHRKDIQLRQQISVKFCDVQLCKKLFFAKYHE